MHCTVLHNKLESVANPCSVMVALRCFLYSASWHTYHRATCHHNDHTLLPVTRHKWTRLSWLLATRPGIEPMSAWSQVRRPNRYATMQATKLLWQCAKISLPWEQGSVGIQFEWYHYIARPPKPGKPPFLYKNLALISYTSRAIDNFMACPSSQLFVTVHRNRVGRGTMKMIPWSTPWSWPTSKASCLVHESGTYLLLHRPNYSQFCAKTPKLLLKEIALKLFYLYGNSRPLTSLAHIGS